MAAGAGLGACNHLEHHVSISALPREAPFQQGARTVNDDAELAFFQSREMDGWTVRADRRRFRLLRSSGTTARALLFSLTAIAMLIFVCSCACRRTEHPGFGSRMLSHEKSGAFGGPGICGEMQEETESSSSDEGSRQYSLPRIFEPSAKKAKVVAGEGRGDEACSSHAPLCSPRQRQSKRRLVRKSRDPLSQPASHSLVEEGGTAAHHSPHSPDPFRPSEQHQLTTGSDESTRFAFPGAGLTMAPTERTSAEMNAASALLLLQQMAPVANAPMGDITHQEDENEPQPSTSAGGMWRPQPADASAGTAEGPGEANQKLRNSPGPSGQDPQLQQFTMASASPSTLPEPYVPELYPPFLIPPQKHPFFRVPKLQPGVVPPTFNTDRASCGGTASRRATSELGVLQALLAKESLSQGDAFLLVIWMEKLAAHCFHHENSRLHKTDFRLTSDTLARRFLALECIVSGFIALEQAPPRDWWEEFVRRIPHQAEVVTGRKRGKMRTNTCHKKLASALSTALESLKKGVRPPNQHLFKLKYMIFCSGRPTLLFDSSFYEPWRNDCPDSL